STLMVSVLFGQRTVSGTITDNNGESLIGASILVKGTTVGTVTDFDGNFSLSVPDGSNTLVISYTGYTTQEVNVANQTVVSIVLEPSSLILDEVVVTGYSTELKREVTSSITSVKAEEIEGLPVQSFDRA